jgi:ABC-2 type transport system ATP-binding protein
MNVEGMRVKTTGPTAPAAIEVDGLTKAYGGRRVLDGIDLRVPRGSAFGFLGPNGAGKTTTLRALLGLIQPSAGRLRILGRALPGERAEALARVGAMVDEPRFLEYLTGRENLVVSAAARGVEAVPRIRGALAEVGLAERTDDRVAGYSQGMRRRLGIARCLLADPELLILDEPMNGLDPAGIIWLNELIARQVERGRTVFLSSHLLGEIERNCDHAAIVESGRVLAQGTIDSLLGDGARRIAVGCDDPPRAAAVIAALPEVDAVHLRAEGIELEVAGEVPDRELVPVIAGLLLSNGVGFACLTPVTPTLESRFLALTGSGAAQ